jgi:hypothetical protein
MLQTTVLTEGGSVAILARVPLTIVLTEGGASTIAATTFLTIMLTGSSWHGLAPFDLNAIQHFVKFNAHCTKVSCQLKF